MAAHQVKRSTASRIGFLLGELLQSQKVIDDLFQRHTARLPSQPSKRGPNSKDRQRGMCRHDTSEPRTRQDPGRKDPRPLGTGLELLPRSSRPGRRVPDGAAEQEPFGWLVCAVSSCATSLRGVCDHAVTTQKGGRAVAPTWVRGEG